MTRLKTTEGNAFLQQFDEVRSQLAGSEPAWLRELRQAGIESFERLGFPGPRDEAWRFTSTARLTRTPFVRSRRVESLNGAEERFRSCAPFAATAGGLLVFVDGFYRPELSRLPPARAGVRLRPLTDAVRAGDSSGIVREQLGKRGAHESHAFSAINTALFTDGAVLEVDDGTALEETVHVVFISSGDTPKASSHTRLLVSLGRGARAALVESHVAAGVEEYFTSSVSEVVLADGAALCHTKFQDDNLAALHVANASALLRASSRYSTHSFSLGGALTRNDIEVVLDGEGIECQINGLYLPRGTQHVDNHTRIVHAKPHCHSFELYKGVMDEQSSAVFNGRIYVAKDAQKTDAKQSNKNILLSDDATINTNPELEIFADDVRCTHGATIGNIDAEQLFYLRARGIEERIARGILTYGFASEVVDLVEDESVRSELGARLFPHLPREARLAIEGT